MLIQILSIFENNTESFSFHSYWYTPNAPPPPQHQQTSQDTRQNQSPRLPKDLPQSPSLSNAENGSSTTETGQLYQMAPPRHSTFPDLPSLRSHIQSHAQNHGFAIATHKSDSKKIIIICDRGGNYKDPFADKEEQRKRKRTSKKLGCPYRVTGRKWASDGLWHVTVTNPAHNHPPAEELAKARNLSRFEELYGLIKVKFPNWTVEEQLSVLETVETINTTKQPSEHTSTPPLSTDIINAQPAEQTQTQLQQQPPPPQSQQVQQQVQQQQQQQQQQPPPHHQHQQHSQPQHHTSSHQSQQQQQQQPPPLQEQPSLASYQQHQPPSSQPPQSQPQQPQPRQPQQIHQPQPQQHMPQSYFYSHPMGSINPQILPSHSHQHPHQPPPRLMGQCNRCGGDHSGRSCGHHSSDPGRAAVELLEDHQNAVEQAFMGGGSQQQHHLRQAHPHIQQPPPMHRGYSNPNMQPSNGVGNMSMGPSRGHPARAEEVVEAENRLREVFGVPVLHS
ncbi:hypothetical protein BJ508DRAFT_83813 [Ascobolus immersus RN42]|uniref:Uncharacterized protein n=1 Tax=Ascobolus immersus RN42 TaxID=1160509 RepID=A0A3N4IDH3_ASCIM|nr:hypothetical protein BJ508DRAFT_83813 [Ascobolus immersus RN42]